MIKWSNAATGGKEWTVKFDAKPLTRVTSEQTLIFYARIYVQMVI